VHYIIYSNKRNNHYKYTENSIWKQR